MRKTKIVCTIGPACDSEETLRAMMLAGMNVARLNFSHGTHAEHQVRIDRIKKLRAELGLPIAIMLDTKGPEYRIGTFENGKIETTFYRAKEVQPVAEKMVTLGKKNTLASYRKALSYITKEDVAKKLFSEIAPKYADRNGGYTRVTRIGPRRGDAAEMAVIELV